MKLSEISQIIQQQLQTSLGNLGVSSVTPEVSPQVNLKFGDLTSNVAMVTHSQLRSSSDKLLAEYSQPRLLAEAIITDLSQRFETETVTASNMGEVKLAELVIKTEVAGPGFINFSLSDQFLLSNIRLINQSNIPFRQWSAESKKKYIVEYSSPNIAKPFTIGHFRSTIIGDALANLLEYAGHQVYRDNHLGDWGTQFGKLIYAIINLGEGEAANIKKISQADQPVKELVKLYVEFHQKAEADPELDQHGRDWFTKLEQGDAKARKLWQMCIDWSWLEFNQIYQQLGVEFTENDGRGFGESYFEDKMEVVVEQLKDKGLLFTGKQGAQLVEFDTDRLPPLMIRKKDGSTLYATRDLATDWFRKQHYGDDVIIINEVGAEQSMYFEQIFETERLLGWFDREQRIHIKHGLYRFTQGKMSTRKGNVIWLREVINQAIQLAEQMRLERNPDSIPDPDLDKQVAIGALKWNDLKGKSEREIIFDWQEMLSMQGNSGPYVQYAGVRAKSLQTVVAEHFQLELSQLFGLMSDYDLDTAKLSQADRDLIRVLIGFESALHLATEKLELHVLAQYLFNLATAFNKYYTQQPILSKELKQYSDWQKLAQAEPALHTDLLLRLDLVRAVEQILKHGLGILGIQVPEKM